MAATKAAPAKADGANAAWSKAEFERVARDYANPDVEVADIAARLEIHPMALIGRMRTKGIKRGTSRSGVAAKSKSRKATTAKPSATRTRASLSQAGEGLLDDSDNPASQNADDAPPVSSAVSPARPKKKSKKKRTRHKPIELVQHVYNAIETELTKLEEQDGTSSQDRERASRALSQMVNSLEKATVMQRNIVKDKTRGSGSKDKEALANAEDLRRKIAERLERLFVKRGTKKAS